MPNPRNRPRAGNALVGIITCPKYRISDGMLKKGTLSIATIRDPAGNVIGVWQDGPR
jgi:hypothetical protein